MVRDSGDFGWTTPDPSTPGPVIPADTRRDQKPRGRKTQDTGTETGVPGRAGGPTGEIRGGGKGWGPRNDEGPQSGVSTVVPGPVSSQTGPVPPGKVRVGDLESRCRTGPPDGRRDVGGRVEHLVPPFLEDHRRVQLGRSLSVVEEEQEPESEELSEVDLVVQP